MIPNIIHFCFGLRQQTEEFYFVYYLSILSAKLVNNPDKIYFYYHYEPFGQWWDKIKPFLTLEKIEIPTHFGKKPIIKTAHAADYVRLFKLFERGGIYFDIDTISCRPYKYLLENSCVMGIQDHGEICNAIMMTEAKHSFFKQWIDAYETVFQTHGWAEASVLFPWNLYHSNRNNEIVKLMPKETFFDPGWRTPQKIFQENVNICSELITLHVWETMSMSYIKEIKDMTWIENNQHTLYSKIVKNLEKYKMVEMKD